MDTEDAVTSGVWLRCWLDVGWMLYTGQTNTQFWLLGRAKFSTRVTH